MNRSQALDLLKSNIKNKNLLKHMYAAEAIMRALAEKFGEDADKWGLTGLLHDIDYDQTANDPDNHALIGGEMLKAAGFDEDIVYAVKAHNYKLELPRKSLMDKAIYACDPLTGLIVASALIHPDKKLSSIDTAFVLNRFKESSFARGANREQIQKCSEMGLDLEEFVTIGLKAMQGIADELGL